jgi:hypothetical protein
MVPVAVILVCLFSFPFSFSNPFLLLLHRIPFYSATFSFLFSGNSTHIANRINTLALGAIQYVYIIQNTPIEDVFDMVDQLAENVEVVSHVQLADLAVQHKRFEESEAKRPKPT